MIISNISNVICYLQHCIYCWLLLREAFSFFFTSHYHCYNDLIAVSVCACVFADAAACDWRSIDYVWFVQLKAALLRWVCGSRGVRSVYQWRWLGAVGGRLIVAAIVFVSVCLFSPFVALLYCWYWFVFSFVDLCFVVAAVGLFIFEEELLNIIRWTLTRSCLCLHSLRLEFTESGLAVSEVASYPAQNKPLLCSRSR